MDSQKNTIDTMKQKHVAIRYKQNSEELSENWQVVWPENNPKAYQFVVIHETLPVHYFYEDMDVMEGIFGDYDIIGETYATAPYIIGQKRIGSVTEGYLQHRLKEIFSKENQIIAHQELYSDPEDQDKRDDIEDMIGSMPDEEYDIWVQEKIDEALPKLLETITEQEAQDIFESFLNSTVNQEILTHNNYIQSVEKSMKPLNSMKFSKFNLK